MSEQRRSRRKSVDTNIEVVNAMTGDVMGRAGNLSVDGMLLISREPLREDSLFQFVFHVPDEQGNAIPIEVGVHEQWTEPVEAAGQYWAGFRIIDISPRDFEVLKSWVEHASNQASNK
jgi:hypothetical protein